MSTMVLPARHTYTGIRVLYGKCWQKYIKCLDEHYENTLDITFWETSKYEKNKVNISLQRAGELVSDTNNICSRIVVNTLKQHFYKHHFTNIITVNFTHTKYCPEMDTWHDTRLTLLLPSQVSHKINFAWIQQSLFTHYSLTWW